MKLKTLKARKNMEKKSLFGKFEISGFSLLPSMKVGIGLPASIPGISDSSLVLKWAMKAEDLGFSSLGLIDRVVYPNYEPLLTFSAAAAVTKRIRLMTTILLVPTRGTSLLAKQAATLDKISNGRLTLGMGIGSRKDDFDATEHKFNDRGKRFERQLALMKKIWNGERINDETGPIGPSPVQKAGPELLIGGYVPREIERVGKWADGYIAGSGGDPKIVGTLFVQVRDSWVRHNREGKPRLVCSQYYAVGDNASSRAGRYLYNYYGGYADRLIKALPTTPDQLEDVLRDYSNAGADEIMLWPTIAEMAQLDLLAQALPEEIFHAQK
jgi:alkanesulfonate monooxygenase SsuD/methylene tetrahydromethanopterin reductase-like flavin-dependent oxidoreductase (luciferase family)